MKPSQIEATIRQLHEEGYKVNVHHYRQYEHMMNGSWRRGSRTAISTKVLRAWGTAYRPAPRGGRVEVVITPPKGETFSCESECSERDGFQGRVGTAIALGRAIDILRSQGQWH